MMTTDEYENNSTTRIIYCHLHTKNVYNGKSSELITNKISQLQLNLNIASREQFRTI